MRLTKQQALLLLDKFRKAILKDQHKEGESDSKLEYHQYDGSIYGFSYVSKTVRFSIVRHSDQIDFNLDSPNGKISGHYRLPFKLFRIFSKVWRQFMKFVLQGQVPLEGLKEKERNRERERFNHVLYSTYPDELNSIILGEDDDD